MKTKTPDTELPNVILAKTPRPGSSNSAKLVKAHGGTDGSNAAAKADKADGNGSNSSASVRRRAATLHR